MEIKYREKVKTNYEKTEEKEAEKKVQNEIEVPHMNWIFDTCSIIILMAREYNWLFL